MHASLMLSARHTLCLLCSMWMLLGATACSDDGGSNGDTPEDDAGGRTDVFIPDAIDSDAQPDATDDVAPDAPPQVCEPNVTECTGRTAQRTCSEDGTEWVEEPCANGEACLTNACETVVPCDPGPLSCVNSTTREICEEDGFTRRTEACSEGSVCIGGECSTPACDPNSKAYVGCEFFATDLPQDPGAAIPPVYVTISNANELPTEVTLTNMATRRTFREEVPAASIRSFALNDIQLFGSSLTSLTYRVETSLPVTVHQFSPRNNSAQVFSNDASLLLPQAAVGTEYLYLGWPTYEFGDSGRTSRASATIVATRNSTTVTLTSPVALAAGDDVQPIAAGETVTFDLDQGEVLHLQTTSVDEADLSGLHIQSTSPIVVFAASECANVPESVAYCDHLEQQLYPVNTWGTRYIASKFAPRGTEDDVWRVLASTDGTVLSTTPAIPGLDGVTLNRGQVVEVATDADFLLTATQPISLAQFMVGSEYPTNGEGQCTRPNTNCAIPATPLCDNVTAIGDPAFLMPVPIEQYLDTYLLLTPADYEQDYVNLTFPTGTGLTFDGEPLDLTDAVSIGDTGFQVLRLPVEQGRHELTGSAPFGLGAYGYDCNVSYAYPGGMNVEPLR